MTMEWNLVFTGSGNNQVFDIAIPTPTECLATTIFGQLYISADAGQTWVQNNDPSRTATNITGMAASNGVVVLTGNALLSIINRSTDGGATWTDVTPIGVADLELQYPFFSKTFQRFIVLQESVGAGLYTSSDGATWNTSTMPADFILPGNTFTPQKTINAFAESGSVVVIVGSDATQQTPVILRSEDAITFTSVGTLDAVVKTWTDVVFSNGLFILIGTDNNHTVWCYSSPDGQTWTARSTSEDINQNTPPYFFNASTSFNNVVYTGFANTGSFTLETTTIGADWNPIDLSSTGLSGSGFLTITPDDLLVSVTGSPSFNPDQQNGIASSSNGTVFTTEQLGNAAIRIESRFGITLGAGSVDAPFGTGAIWRRGSAVQTYPPGGEPSVYTPIISNKVLLRWSDDGGITWSEWLDREVGSLGNYFEMAQFWQLGEGRNRVFHVRFVGNQPCSLMGATIDATKGMS